MCGPDSFSSASFGLKPLIYLINLDFDTSVLDLRFAWHVGLMGQKDPDFFRHFQSCFSVLSTILDILRESMALFQQSVCCVILGEGTKISLLDLICKQFSARELTRCL